MKQWPSSPWSVLWAQALNCVTMQHHLFEKMHKTFTTFIWFESTNPFTQEWYFAKWMMALRIPSTK
jgi:hypothetical protein